MKLSGLLAITALLVVAISCGELSEHKGKLAFLFMIYERHLNPEIWREFFKDAPKDKYVIMYHVKF